MRLGQFLGVEEVPTVDHRSRQGAVIDLRTGARTPGGAGLGRVELSQMVAEEFEGVATLDKRQPLRDQSLQFDRPDFRAVLFGVGTTLRGLVVVEISADTLRLAVEEIDEGPKESGRSASSRVSIKRPARASTANFERKRRGV